MRSQAENTLDQVCPGRSQALVHLQSEPCSGSCRQLNTFEQFHKMCFCKLWYSSSQHAQTELQFEDVSSWDTINITGVQSWSLCNCANLSDRPRCAPSLYCRNKQLCTHQSTKWNVQPLRRSCAAEDMKWKVIKETWSCARMHKIVQTSCNLQRCGCLNYAP